MLNRQRDNGATRVGYSIIDFAVDATNPEAVRDSTAGWLDSAEMTELFDIFGYKIQSSGVRDRLAEAEEVSREIFDFRRGGERWQAAKAEFTPRTTAVVNALISDIYREPVGDPLAELGEFDHALVLGGRINTCLLRSELLADLIAERLPVGNVWGLGSRRQVTDDERRFAATLTDVPVDDELDAMSVGLAESFGLGFDTAGRKTPGESEVRELAARPVPITGLAAAPGPGKPRATTSDTYRFFLDTAEHPAAAEKILIVTSAIHGPFQHAQALSELGLPTGARLTTVGAHIGTSRYAGVRTEWTTAEWLQEVRSAIWSLRMMYNALLNEYPELEN